MNKPILILFILLFSVNSLIAQIITTIAGMSHNFNTSGDGGPAINASLRSPSSVAVDKKGNIYIVDINSFVVRKINTAGIISNFAGNRTLGYSGDGGPAVNAQMVKPVCIAFDKKGNLYIADYDVGVIRKVDTFGIISNFAGKLVLYGAYIRGDGGLAINAQFSPPYSITADKVGNIYFGDEANSTIRKVDTSGIISTFAGNQINGYSGDGGPAVNAELGLMFGGMTTDAAGNFYFEDPYNYVIRKVDTKGIITTIVGNGKTGYSGDGGPAINAQVGSLSGNMAIDKAGNLFFSDPQNHVVRKVNKSGIISTYAGNGIAGFSGDNGIAVKAMLSYPQGLALDSSGNLLITDIANNNVRKVIPCNLQPSFSHIDTVICKGSTFQIKPNRMVSASGVYIDTLFANSGCDSIYINDTIRIDSSTRIPKTIPICSGKSVSIGISGLKSYLWNTGATTDSIAVNQPAIYTVLTTDSFGCRAIDTFNVTAYDNPVLNLPKDTTVCLGGLIMVGTGYQSYIWNTGSILESTIIYNTGFYWVKVIDKNGCSASDTVNIISLLSAPANFLIKDTVLCDGSHLTIKPFQPFNAYLWSDGTTNPEIDIYSPGTYWLKVTDNNGCDGTDTLNVSLKNCNGIFNVPNIFSPNGDGVNDTWKILFLNGITDASVDVFNRYGQRVFHSIGYNKEWDGKFSGQDLPIGTYYYIIKSSLQDRPLSGSVTIIR